MALVRTFTRVQAGVLLYVTELLEPAIAIAAFVRFLAGVDPDVLDELVVAGERLEALLALVRLYLVPGDHPARSNADRAQPRQSARNAAASSPRQCTRRAELPRVHLHRALVHEDLREELVRQVVMRMLIRRRYVRRVARMIVGVRSGMVLMLGLRRERLGRRGRCPRPVVRPVAFIGAIHLQGRISSTRPEESLPPSTHGDTKDSDTDMATLIPGRIRDTLDSDSLSATSCCVPRSPAFEMLRDPWRSDVATRRPPFILYSPPIFSRQTLPLPPPSDSSYLLRREEGRQEGRRDSFSPIFIIRYLFIIRRNKRRTATFLFFFFFFEREHDHAFVA